MDGHLAGLLAIADPIKASTPEALRDLRALGLRIIMLTGDNRVTAEHVARQLGIEEVIAEVLPADLAIAFRDAIDDLTRVLLRHEAAEPRG